MSRSDRAKALLIKGGVYPQGCSGFVCAVLGIEWKSANALMGGTPEFVGENNNYEGLVPGDIVGWTDSNQGHVAIYVGEQGCRIIDVRSPNDVPRKLYGYGPQKLFKSTILKVKPEYYEETVSIDLAKFILNKIAKKGDRNITRHQEVTSYTTHTGPVNAEPKVPEHISIDANGSSDINTQGWDIIQDLYYEGYHLEHGAWHSKTWVYQKLDGRVEHYEVELKRDDDAKWQVIQPSPDRVEYVLSAASCTFSCDEVKIRVYIRWVNA